MIETITGLLFLGAIFFILFASPKRTDEERKDKDPKK